MIHAHPQAQRFGSLSGSLLSLCVVVTLLGCGARIVPGTPVRLQRRLGEDSRRPAPSPVYSTSFGGRLTEVRSHPLSNNPYLRFSACELFELVETAWTNTGVAPVSSRELLSTSRSGSRETGWIRVEVGQRRVCWPLTLGFGGHRPRAVVRLGDVRCAGRRYSIELLGRTQDTIRGTLVTIDGCILKEDNFAQLGVPVEIAGSISVSLLPARTTLFFRNSLRLSDSTVIQAGHVFGSEDECMAEVAP